MRITSLLRRVPTITWFLFGTPLSRLLGFLLTQEVFVHETTIFGIKVGPGRPLKDHKKKDNGPVYPVRGDHPSQSHHPAISSRQGGRNHSIQRLLRRQRAPSSSEANITTVRAERHKRVDAKTCFLRSGFEPTRWKKNNQNRCCHVVVFLAMLGHGSFCCLTY